MTNVNSSVAKDVIDPSFIPRDDASMANYIAEQYKKHGINPNAAYDSVEEALGDFGGIEEMT